MTQNPVSGDSSGAVPTTPLSRTQVCPVGHMHNASTPAQRLVWRSDRTLVVPWTTVELLKGCFVDTTGRLLRHMRWANQQVYAAVAELPESALQAHIVNPEWQVGQILQHIVRAARRYQSLLWPEDGWEDVAIPMSMADVRELALALDAADARLAEAVRLDDARFERRRWDGELVTVERLTVLAQSVHHATEHRAQVLDALNARGYEPLSLDDLDLWSFEIHDR